MKEVRATNKLEFMGEDTVMKTRDHVTHQRKGGERSSLGMWCWPRLRLSLFLYPESSLMLDPAPGVGFYGSHNST